MLDETLKTKIIKHLVDSTGAESWSLVGDEIKSTDCFVYRLSSPNYPEDIALKLYHQDKSSKKEPHYAAIKRFSSSLNMHNTKYKVPKPYGFFEDENCFLMEWATGEDIETLLWKNVASKKHQQSLIIDAYSWLKHFHSEANPSIRKVDIEFYATNITLQSQSLKMQELSDNNAIFKAGFKTLVSFSQQFTDYETRHADIHGDLNLSNIIMDEHHVTGIDIGAMNFAPIEHDMTLMLNYICITYINMLTRFDMRKPVSTWEIFNVALDAYGYSKEKKARDFFVFVFLYQMLRRWVSGYYLQKTSVRHENKTLAITLLEKWRLHNSSVIVKALTRVINERLLIR